MKKVILAFILGLSLSAIGVAALSLCNAKDIEYKASDTTWDVDTVEDALNDLYQEDMCTLPEVVLDILKRPTIYIYNENLQEYVVPITGTYKIELWGAQGLNNYGGLGGYVAGEIKLKEKQKLLVHVGTRGDSTDIRLDESLVSRIIVAGAGGGGFYYNECGHGYDPATGGAGGGLDGYPGASGTMGTKMIREAQGGTQKSGGLYGYGNEYPTIGSSGQFGIAGTSSAGITGLGGNGYYGGGGSGRAYCNGGSGGGGSSFISGHEGCDAVAKGSTDDNITHSGQSVHYSGYSFSNTVMIDGMGYNWTNVKGDLIKMPDHDGIDVMIGNSGDGFAKITFISQ